MGLLMASTRVYVNEFMMFDLWSSTTFALNPFDIKESIRKNFKPGDFDLIGTVRKDPNSPWMLTEKRMPNMALFLQHLRDSFPLADAMEIEREGKVTKNGKDYLTTDAAVLTRQNRVRRQLRHVSQQQAAEPDADGSGGTKDGVARSGPTGRFPHGQLPVGRPALSDFAELGTNVLRAMGTNAMAGNTWGQMSSQTYKDLRAPTELVEDRDADGKPIPLYNPLTGKHDIKFTAHKSFYRTPTLVSIWATAPYLNNNSVGIYTGDPSVAGRMAAYEDGMTKLLWPEKRLGTKSILVTTEDSTLPDLFPVLKKLLPEFADLPDLDVDLLRVPKGTPINLVMNVHPKDIKAVLQAYVDGVLQGQPRTRFAELRAKNSDAALQRMMEKLVEVNMSPDFIEDRGHTYGHELSDQDKQALIEYMKYF